MAHPAPGLLVQARLALAPVWGWGGKGRVLTYCPASG